MDKQKVCPVCKKAWEPTGFYCRYCGAKKSRPKYIEQDFACIYGPMPRKRKHKCEKCGLAWTTERMIDDERYCPLCGGEAPVVWEENNDIEWDFGF